MKAAGYCERCDWGPVVTEPRGGQSLFGTLGDLMARHAGKTGHEKLGIDWDRTAVGGSE